MASLLQSSPLSSLSFSSCSSWSFLPFNSSGSLTLNSTQNSVRCNVLEPLKFDNVKPQDSILGGQATMLPNVFAPRICSENDVVNNNDTRLRILSSTANPALAQEIASYISLELGKIKIKRC